MFVSVFMLRILRNSHFPVKFCFCEGGKVKKRKKETGKNFYMQ